MMQEPICPDDFIITRKRKKYKFAKFALSEQCYEFDEWSPRPIDVIEIGAGTGMFSVELAARYPEKQFLALDVKADRLQTGAYEAHARKVTNISFVRARADQINQLVPEHSVSSIWVTFADPFPKKGSAGRRLTHSTFLKLYEAALKTGGQLFMKHDNDDFFQWSLEQLVEQKWCIDALTFDVHERNHIEDAQIMTTYEQRWLNEGRTVSFCRAIKARVIADEPVA